ALLKCSVAPCSVSERSSSLSSSAETSSEAGLATDAGMDAHAAATRLGRRRGVGARRRLADLRPQANARGAWRIGSGPLRPETPGAFIEVDGVVALHDVDGAVGKGLIHVGNHRGAAPADALLMKPSV